MVYLQVYISFFCRSLPDHYDGQLYKAHCEVLYGTLLIHLDDSSEQMQVIGYQYFQSIITASLSSYSHSSRTFAVLGRA